MPLPAGRPLPDRRLLRDDVFVWLREAIVDGTLAPGEQLRDQDLAAWLGVSRTPVREALLRLQESGLVQTSPHRSTAVTTLSARATHDAQSVVAAMHRMVVAAAVPLLTESDILAMRAANDVFAAALRAGDAEAALRADDELHGIPVRAAGNHAAAGVLEQYTPLLRRVERQRFASVAGRGSVDLHARLIDRCLAGDVPGAEAVAFETWQTLAPLLDLPDPTPSAETH